LKNLSKFLFFVLLFYEFSFSDKVSNILSTNLSDGLGKTAKKLTLNRVSDLNLLFER